MTTLTTALEIANQALALIGESKAITALDADASIQDRLCNRFYYQARDEVLELHPWKHAIEHRPLVLTANYAEYGEVYNYDPIPISAITKASPALVTTSSVHGFVTGDYVKISDVSGMTEVNRELPYHVSKVTDYTFWLTGINSTNWTTYTSGGEAIKQQPHSDYEDGYTYELPSDFAYAIELTTGEDFIIKGISDAGPKLITIQDDAVLIYIKNDCDDVSYWKSLFINLVAHRLAIKISVPIIGAANGFKIKLELQKAYQLALNELLLLSARETKKTEETTDPWITARG